MLSQHRCNGQYSLHHGRNNIGHRLCWPIRCVFELGSAPFNCRRHVLGADAGTRPGPTPSAAGALFIVNQPWVRPAKTAQTTEAYMNLTSTEGARLVAVRTDAAKEAAIRAPGKTTVNAPSVRLPAGTLVALAPGQYRLVLKQLIKTLAAGRPRPDDAPHRPRRRLASGHRGECGSAFALADRRRASCAFACALAALGPDCRSTRSSTSRLTLRR